MNQHKTENVAHRVIDYANKLALPVAYKIVGEPAYDRLQQTILPLINFIDVLQVFEACGVRIMRIKLRKKLNKSLNFLY